MDNEGEEPTHGLKDFVGSMSCRIDHRGPVGDCPLQTQWNLSRLSETCSRTVGHVPANRDMVLIGKYI